MPHAYTEDQLVEQPAIGLFAELGWAVAVPPPNAGVAGEPRDAGLLGRETKGEVVLVSRLCAALERLNPALPPEAITAALSGNGPVSPIGETACFSETRLRPVATPYLSGWQAAGVTREFPTSSYLSRKRPA
jgi:hypothetical protein